MSHFYWLSDAQMARLRRYFPKSHGVPRVDDSRVLTGFIFINRNGLRWRDALRELGSHKTPYNRWKRWSNVGVFARIATGLAVEAPAIKTISIPFSGHSYMMPCGAVDATYLKAHRTASSLRAKKGNGRLMGRTKGGMNTKLHAVTDAIGRPIRFFMTAGEVCDYTGAGALASSLPAADRLLG